MACSIKFVRLDDFIADVDELDLTTNGYSLAVDGYFPTAAPDDATSVREVITLKLQGTSKDDLAAMTQDIDEKIKQVGWWLKDPGIERYQVWIRVQLENESLPRQAQIISIMPPDKVRIFTPEEKLDNYIGDYQIGIERTPFWEDPYPYPTTTSKSSISTIGGMVQLSETINGDVPARLPLFSLLPDNANNNSFTDFWVGFRSSRLGNPANFQPIWSCSEAHSGSFTPPDTTLTADASTVSGTRVTVAFTLSATMATRFYLLLSEVLTVPANVGDQRGTFTVLLRAKVSDQTTQCMARIIYSFSSVFPNNSPVYRGTQPISTPSNTDDYNFYEMGKIVIPPFRIRPSIDLSNFAVGIQASRTSGSGSLYLDCLVLIPTDEGSAKVVCPLGATSSTQGLINVYQYADNEITASYGETTSPTKIIANAIARPDKSFDLPANNEKPYVILAAAQRNLTAYNGALLDNTLGLDYSYIPRWRTLRGNVT